MHASMHVEHHLTPSSSVILNLVICGSVIGSFPVLRILRKRGITEPLDPITFPYLTTENLISLAPRMLLAENEKFVRG